jgi:hypothetical protein
MFGHYRVSIDLEESIGEIGLLLSAVTGNKFSTEMTTMACTHYKHMALVCACAFMMSPVSLSLADRHRVVQVRNSMAENIQSVYPMFQQEESRWGYQETMTVVTELAFNFVNTILFFYPQLKVALGLPHLYTFTPIQIGTPENYLPDPRQMGTPHEQRMAEAFPVIRERKDPANRLSFTLWVRPGPNQRLLT